MRERLPKTLFILFLSSVLCSAFAAPENPADAERITPDEARRALSVLEQDDQRAEVVQTLNAIANGAPQVSGDAPVAPIEAPTDQAPSEPDNSVGSAIVPLEADGLIAQTLSQIGRWVQGLGQQLDLLKQAMFELPPWFQETFNSAAGRASAGQILLALCAVFALGLCAEWVGNRVLRRPRKELVAHAEEMETHARTDEAQRRAEEAHAAQVPESEAQVASDARIRPESDSVALLQTVRDGVEQIDVIPLGGTPLGGTRVEQSAIGMNSAAEPDADKVRVATKTAGINDESAWSALRHLPYAIGALLLDLLPLVLFFFAAGMVLHLLPDIGPRTHAVSGGFVNAYIISRVAMAMVRLLVSPAGYGLRVLRVSQSVSRLLHLWMRCFVVLATFGIALADAVQLMGAGAAGRVVIIKLVSLLVHLGVVILIFQIRRPVAVMIAAPDDANGPLASMRNWLGKIWALLAAVLVAGLWVIWALGIENGFPRLIAFIGVSVAIIVLGRLVAVLALGALARLVRSETSIDVASGGAQVGEPDVLGRLTEQYYPFVRRLVSFVITLGTLVALLQAWGLNAIGWFAPGTIGGNITSAALTIMVAVAIAVVVWQVANVSLQKRIKRWNVQGEIMRAARLRTLVPMLRSVLFVIIALVVGLTALSELGINTTPLLAGASIIGVAVGFGSQKLVQDFITGIFLLMENTMQVGDWVTVAGVSGTVENLSIRTVRLRAGDGSLHIVPFSSVSTVNNTNRGIGNAAVRIGVSFDTNIEQAISELKDIGAQLRKDPAFEHLIISDLAVWGVDAVDGAMVTLAGQMSCIDKGRWGVQREINRRILERFRELGIHIADPRERPLLMPEDNAAPGPGA